MLVSVIVPAYKDIQALELILYALKYQTYKNFEVVIAEDDDSHKVKEFLETYESNYNIKHFSQRDEGARKATAVNNAIKISMGEYIIFIDGDVIPYSSFIASHVELSEDNAYLCGRRVNCDKVTSNEIRNGKLKIVEFENKLLSSLFCLIKNKSRHVEQGLCLKPNGIVHKILSFFDNNIHILGANFSLYKDKILAINGIDEDLYGGWNDYDIEWRLNAIGLHAKSCKYTTGLLHLNHDRFGRKERNNQQKEYILKKQKINEYFCKSGLTDKLK